MHVGVGQNKRYFESTLSKYNTWVKKSLCWTEIVPKTEEYNL